jgi:hypothetical protein
MIHMPDVLYEKIGKIQRNRLTGDTLIATARMQTLAKALGEKMCVSIFRGGHLENNKQYHLQKITDKYTMLKKEHREWLEERQIDAYAVSYT